MSDSPQKFRFTCPKCQNSRYDLSELRGSSGGLSAYMNLDLAVVTLVTCTQCTFTEMYRIPVAEFKRQLDLK